MVVTDWTRGNAWGMPVFRPFVCGLDDANMAGAGDFLNRIADSIAHDEFKASGTTVAR